MKTIATHAFSKCLWGVIGLFLALVTELPAYAQSLSNGRADEQTLSIEAPLVQLVFERAALMERSDPRIRNQQYAARLYCVAARLGSIEAQYRLGKMILAGWGMKQSKKNAATLFSIAASQGHEKAGLILAKIGVQSESLPACMESPGASIEADAGGTMAAHARSLHNEAVSEARGAMAGGG